MQYHCASVLCGGTHVFSIVSSIAAKQGHAGSAPRRGKGKGKGPGQGAMPAGMASLSPAASRGEARAGGPMRGGGGLRAQPPKRPVQAQNNREQMHARQQAAHARQAAAPHRPGRARIDNLPELVFWLGLVSAVGQMTCAMLRIAKFGAHGLPAGLGWRK